MKPTKADLLAATGKTVSDVIAPHLRILFCGINPGLYSGYTGHHFARPGNRFWPTLYAAGFTDRLLSPAEEDELLDHGYGITNLVERATATANELTAIELVVGSQRLVAKVEQYQPQVVAILGVSAYRTSFARPRAALGRQLELVGPARSCGSCLIPVDLTRTTRPPIWPAFSSIFASPSKQKSPRASAVVHCNCQNIAKTEHSCYNLSSFFRV